MNQLNSTLENLSLNEATPYVLATTIKSTSSRPSDFTGLPRDVVIERLRNREFIRLHGNFIKRVFQGETNEVSFNIRVVLCSFFADAGMRDTFPDEVNLLAIQVDFVQFFSLILHTLQSCVQVATAFTSLYEPIIEQYASGSEPNEDSKSALFSVLRNLVDVFRAHGIETAEKSRKRLIEIIRMIIDAKKVIQQEENNLQAMESVNFSFRFFWISF